MNSYEKLQEAKLSWKKDNARKYLAKCIETSLYDVEEINNQESLNNFLETDPYVLGIEKLRQDVLEETEEFMQHFDVAEEAKKLAYLRDRNPLK
jgi:hypothetical protein